MRWILIQYEDFELNANLLKTLRKFLEVDVRQAGFVMEAECIEKNISIKSLSPIKNCSVIMEQGRFCLQRSRTRKISLSRSQVPPLPSQTSNSASSTLEPVPQSPVEHMIEYGPTPELAPSSPILQLNGQDLARYLTLADMKAFRSITVFELMSGWWKRRQAAENKRSDREERLDEVEPKTPSALSAVEVDGAEDGAIEAFTRRANMLSYWVAHEIVSTAGSKTRKQLIKKFIEVAKICRQLNNLHTSMFIVSALTSKPVRRLNSSWKLVSSKDMETLKNLEVLMDPSGNMRCYRQAIAEAEAPTIPFLPILLKDITFILDGNPTMIASKANLSPEPQPSPTSAPVSTSGSTTPTSAPPPSTTTPTPPNSNNKGAPLVNFDKFRRLTQYVENAVDMAKSVDYSFEHQLLRQARVFRPSSPSLYGETESVNGNGGTSLLGGKSGSAHGFLHGSSNGGGPAPDGSRGALDHISETVERRLVKASGLYGVHQRVIQVEFVNRAHGSKSNGASGLWKSSGGDGASNNGNVHGSMAGNGIGGSDMVIRAVQGEEDYLMGLSRMCEPARW
ncbi:MAG: ras guanine nucleotide exchange factor domain-containing protein [Linnemannia elongata]|nr:MAG: ras guanine nucleotide exchange factor domain-containing protein [Linnemannia elongata]